MDYEANEAMNRLCEFFKLLNEMDLRQKAAEAAQDAEQQATSQ